ncbi:MAG TPA: hypothetical protein VHN15_09970 [Thermoanaerobaculia bacterium]|nr:hypothetical protein [Thermoanaerobaculia bacterium]
MNRHTLSNLALVSVLTLSVGTVGCSEGTSPTEPAFSDLDSSVGAVTSGGADGSEGVVTADDSGTISSVTDESRGRGRGRGGRGGNGNDDDGVNNNRRGRGQDDNQPDDRGRRGRRGRGNQPGQPNQPNQPGTPQAGQGFEGAVARVGGNSVTLTNGQTIVVTGQTQWIARGDLHSLSQIQGSLNAGRNPRVEGRGVRQADGTIRANTIKAEDEQ